MTAIYLNSFWLVGIFFASLVEVPREAILLAAIATSVLLWGWRKFSLATLVLSLLVFLLGLVRYDGAALTAGADDLLALAQEDEVALRGTVVAEPELRARTANLVLSVNEARVDDGWIEVNGDILVQVPRPYAHVYGERLELRGRLEEPENFADFDYRSYLARQGIRYLMRYPRVASAESPLESNFLAVLYSFKRHLARGLDLSLPEPQSSLAKGVLLGIRSALPDELRSAFSLTNTSHILAISGWNITLIAGLLRVVGGRFLGRAGLVLFVIAGIGLYTLLIGPQPSVLRAAIMGSLLLIGVYFGRPGDTVVGLLFAATIMTALDPFYLWDVGFQLSFASTAGIALFVPRLQRLLRFRPVWLADSVAVTLAAQLATLPITAAVFGQFSTVTLVANALVLPATLPIMLLSAVTALIALVWSPLAQIVGLAAWIFLTYMIRVVEYLASMPWASISIGSFAPLLALPYYALVAVLFTGKSRDSSEPRGPALQTLSLATKTLLGFLAICAVLVWAAFFSLSEHKLRISFLDVGQGDAILVETPSGHRVLVDGGPSPPKLLDALGRRMPFWDRSIDLVVLTHPNEDHLAGLIEVLERLDVKQVLEPRTTVNSANYRRWHEIVGSKKISRIEAHAGQEIDLHDGTIIQVLHPRGEVTSKDANESSIVLKVVAGEVSVLLTGDVDADSQQAMVDSGLDLASSIFKVPHHGARDSLNGAFLDAVRPSVAVISVGKDNAFGHPAPETLAMLSRAHVLRTDLDGTIEIAISDGAYEVNSSR